MTQIPDEDAFKYRPPATATIPKPDGYRKMPDEDFALFNTIGKLGNNTGEMCKLVIERDDASLTPEQRSERKRWAHIARTQLQQGFMALKRAVALPENF